MSRSKLLSTTTNQQGACVLYVMSRDQRAADNHAIIRAQAVALKRKLPLIVLFVLYPKSGVRSREHYRFMVDGLKQLERTLAKLHIPFIIRQGKPEQEIAALCKIYDVGHMVFDFSPLRGPRGVQKNVANNVSFPVEVVDAHNIIPTWVLSEKQEYAAHTIRRKVHAHLADWLTEPETIDEHPHKYTGTVQNDWEAIDTFVQQIRSSGITPACSPGEDAAMQTLERFIDERLPNYASNRNDPNSDGQSGLSPYLHFGQISAQRVAYEVTRVSSDPPLLFSQAKMPSYDDKPTLQDSIDAFLEELIVRRELSDNYAYYNGHYKSLEGAAEWAKETLKEHAEDTREYRYSLDELETATTHDPAWNAAQKEMATTGKMHGYMRMYWAKKILEWSPSPEQAITHAIYLNDRYSIDGGDPNGYVGILWSIAGLHDRPWTEREVFGKIRYMNYAGLKRKFDVDAYVARWSAQQNS